MNRFDAEVRWREGGYRLGKIVGQNLNEALARREASAPARVTAFVEQIGEKHSLQPTVETLQMTFQNHFEGTRRRPSLTGGQGLKQSSARR